MFRFFPSDILYPHILIVAVFGSQSPPKTITCVAILPDADCDDEIHDNEQPLSRITPLDSCK